MCAILMAMVIMRMIVVVSMVIFCVLFRFVIMVVVVRPGALGAVVIVRLLVGGVLVVVIPSMRRLAVVDCSAEGRAPLRLANPEILHASARLHAQEEASPNLPGVSAMVERPRAVTVRFLDDGGETVERDFVGLWAASVQHQVDHLDGRMYFDRLSPLRRRMLLARAKKKRARA